jgi:hypothetical protein
VQEIVEIDVTDFLDEKRKEIEGRLRELRPLVEEYQRLEKAAAALAGVTSAPSRSAQRSAGRRRRNGGGRGRPRGSGKRALQAYEIVRARPGITIPELADAMGIKTNYLYRVMPALQSEGKVRKDGNAWHPA